MLFDDPPHTVDIYLPSAPTIDAGGGVQLNWPDTPSQSCCPCIINTQGAGTVMRNGQDGITVNNQISFLSDALDVVLVRDTKFVATDTGRTFILRGLRAPNRSFNDIPQLAYANCDEIL